MPKMNLSHFEAALLFSLFTSVVMGVVTKQTDRDRLHYGIYVFVCFAIGWRDLLHSTPRRRHRAEVLCVNCIKCG